MQTQEKSPAGSKSGRTKAVAYMRTSSAANVGADKDSERRQRLAIAAYAKIAKLTIESADWFYDPAVRGEDTIEARPGFNKLLDRIENNGVRVVLIEDATRFARDLMTQELGILSLIKLGVRVITATGDDLTDTSDPMKKAMRQIAGAFAELEKARLVAKLRGARERKRAEKGKCEGRKAYAERKAEDGEPVGRKLVEAAQALNDGRSLRKIAAAIAEQGYLTPTGREYSASAVKSMLGEDGLKSRALKLASYASKMVLPTKRGAYKKREGK